MMDGHLKSKSIFVQRDKLRKSIHRVDHDGVEARKTITIKRRKYSVPCPNYIWHIDGTHKLIRWKMVIHAAIDGYSRLIVYCKCNTYNKSSTVFKLYHCSVVSHRLPIKVRSDYGGENTDVWRFMHENERIVLVGSSVHNQRIERLNRDINTQVVNFFYNEFFKLEDKNLLDPLNKTDLFALHAVYKPEINRRIGDFIASHNNHRLSSENGHTPLQLFAGNYDLLQLHLPKSNNDTEQHVMPDVNEELMFERIPNPLTTEETGQMNELIQENLNNGKPLQEIYQTVLTFVGNTLL